MSTTPSDAAVLTIPRSSRAFLVGTTGTGKSTLMEVLMKEYQEAYSQERRPVRAVIIDTKPRFKAERELSGLPTSISRRYAKWGYGSGILPGSFVLPGIGSIKSELDQVWRLGGTIAIAHAERETEWRYASRVASVFYEQYGAKYPRLLLVDELSDFFKYRTLGDIFQRVARNGRERDCALIAGSQRPRKVPVEMMTEMRRLYMFKLDFGEDMKHILNFGIPLTVTRPSGFSFYMYDKDLEMRPPSHNYYQLEV